MTESGLFHYKILFVRVAAERTQNGNSDVNMSQIRVSAAVSAWPSAAAACRRCPRAGTPSCSGIAFAEPSRRTGAAAVRLLARSLQAGAEARWRPPCGAAQEAASPRVEGAGAGGHRRPVLAHVCIIFVAPKHACDGRSCAGCWLTVPCCDSSALICCLPVVVGSLFRLQPASAHSAPPPPQQRAGVAGSSCHG